MLTMDGGEAFQPRSVIDASGKVICARALFGASQFWPQSARTWFFVFPSRVGAEPDNWCGEGGAGDILELIVREGCFYGAAESL